jgi:UDP-N-acetyl-D-galactosamine dehydrogenase
VTWNESEGFRHRSRLSRFTLIDISRELQDYGIDVQVHDPLAIAEEVEHEYGLAIVPFETLKPASAL